MFVRNQVYLFLWFYSTEYFTVVTLLTPERVNLLIEFLFQLHLFNPLHSAPELIANLGTVPYNCRNGLQLIFINIGATGVSKSPNSFAT